MSECHIHYLVDAKGEVNAVQLSTKLWSLVQKEVMAAQRRLMGPEDPFSKPQPMDALEELKTYWDFKYPYDPHVQCKGCGAQSSDWEEDPQHPFHLVNANFGGLLVFRCRQCGGTVRKKHFREHVVFEFTPAEKGCTI